MLIKIIKKLLLTSLFIGTSALGQEITVKTTSYAGFASMRYNEYIDCVKPGFNNQNGVWGIYIIEVEGQKYIVNAAGGIVRHETKENK